MRLAVVLALAALAALAMASLAPAKEGARAHLTSALPLDAAPGTTIRVRWTVDVPNDKGGRIPFGAGQMAVRLLSRTGGKTTTGFTNTNGGLNTADVVVPVGGIGGIRIGLLGMTDAQVPPVKDPFLYFPLVNDPFLSPARVHCDVAAVRRMLLAFVRAYDRSDMDRLDRLFARSPNRRTLVATLRRRRHGGERLTLLHYRFDRGARFQFSVRRQGTAVTLRGKGALDCAKAPLTLAGLSLASTTG